MFEVFIHNFILAAHDRQVQFIFYFLLYVLRNALNEYLNILKLGIGSEHGVFYFQQGCKFFQSVFLSVRFLQRVGSLFTAAILG